MGSSVQELNDRFVYKRDRKEHWTILRNLTGPLEGDCEDYALTLLWFESQRSTVRALWALFRGTYKIWFCYYTPTGEGHAVLSHDGEYIDNIQKRWVSDLGPLGYDMRYPFPFWKVLWKLRFYMLQRVQALFGSS